MKKYLEDYIKETDKKIKENAITEKDITCHLTKIKFFQNERLIHLLVTLSYGIFLFLSVIISFKTWLFLIILYLVLIILIFYVKHYFLLENGVQYLYKQYDKMQNIIEKSTK